MNQPARVLHEASSQRQHLRLKTPVVAAVEGKMHRLDNWSVGGIGLIDFEDEVLPGTRLPVTLHFPFEGFEMKFDTVISVKHFDGEKKVLGGAFEEMSPQRLSLLRFVIDSYLTGETVDAGDVLQIVGRDNNARARSKRDDSNEVSRIRSLLISLRRNFGLLILLIATLILAGYVAFNLYARTFTVAGDGAITSPQAVVLRAPGAGVIIGFSASPGARVQPGTLLASMQQPDGQVQNVVSDCDCIIGEYLADVGNPLTKAAPILSMVPTSGSTRATLIVRLQDIRKVKVNDRAAINFFNDDRVAMGVVESVNLPGLTDPTTLKQNGLKVPELAGSVTVRFEDPIAAKRIGQPVSGRIRLYRIPVFDF